VTGPTDDPRKSFAFAPRSDELVTAASVVGDPLPIRGELRDLLTDTLVQSEPHGGISVEVAGQIVTVSGNVINGAMYTGTFFIIKP
jgi:hypothetical protein